MIYCEENQTLFDIALMTEGSLENFYQNVMVRYQFEEPTQDIAQIIIENPIYNTANQTVFRNELDGLKIVTGSALNFEPLGGEFNDDYDESYNI